MRLITIAALLAAAPAVAQTSSGDSITFYELPAFLGRSVTITSAIPQLGQGSLVGKAQSARVTGSWTVCPQPNYRGECQELTGSSQALRLQGVTGNIASLRPTADEFADGDREPAGGALADLDPNEGVDGQDTEFFARPTLNGTQVAAGANDRAAADAFCRQAGLSRSVYAGRGRVQVANIIDISGARALRVRGFPLRDVLCRK